MAARPTLQPCNHVEECQHLKPSPVAQWCRLQGDDTKMEVDWLTVLWPRADRFEVGAVSGSMLYLTTFCPPISGAILGIDLTRPDEEPKARVCFWQDTRTIQDGVCRT